MSAQPPTPSELGPDDPVGFRYPNTARIWNYQLGGKDNFAVDREASEAANAMVRAMGVPAGADTALESRHLLQRMVDYMLGQGIRQFLDLGTGQRDGALDDTTFRLRHGQIRHLRSGLSFRPAVKVGGRRR